MNPVTDKFVALNKTQAETALRAFQIGFNAWELLIKLNLEASRSLFQEGLANLQAMPATLQAGAVGDWNVQLHSGAEKMSGYARNVYEIGGQVTGEIGNLLEQTLLNSTQEAVEWIDEVLKASSIPQPEMATAAAKAAMANAKSVIEGISKAVRQTAGYADANVRAAAAATADAVKGTAR